MKRFLQFLHSTSVSLNEGAVSHARTYIAARKAHELLSAGEPYTTTPFPMRVPAADFSTTKGVWAQVTDTGKYLGGVYFHKATPFVKHEEPDIINKGIGTAFIPPTGMKPDVVAHELRHGQQFAGMEASERFREARKDPKFQEDLAAYYINPTPANKQAVASGIIDRPLSTVPKGRSKHLTRFMSDIGGHGSFSIGSEVMRKLSPTAAASKFNPDYSMDTVELDARQQQDIHDTIRPMELAIKTNNLGTLIHHRLSPETQKTIADHLGLFAKSGNRQHLHDAVQTVKNGLVQTTSTTSYFASHYHTQSKKILDELRSAFLNGAERSAFEHIQQIPDSKPVFSHSDKSGVLNFGQYRDTALRAIDRFQNHLNQDLINRSNNSRAAAHLVLTHGLGIEDHIAQHFQTTQNPSMRLPEHTAPAVAAYRQETAKARDPDFKNFPGS